jgi:hypothetical protein
LVRPSCSSRSPRCSPYSSSSPLRFTGNQDSAGRAVLCRCVSTAGHYRGQRGLFPLSRFIHRPFLSVVTSIHPDSFLATTPPHPPSSLTHSSSPISFRSPHSSPPISFRSCTHSPAPFLLAHPPSPVVVLIFRSSMPSLSSDGCGGWPQTCAISRSLPAVGRIDGVTGTSAIGLIGCPMAARRTDLHSANA